MLGTIAFGFSAGNLIRNRLSVLSLLLAVSSPLLAAPAKTTYRDHILPILEANCAKCHNPDKMKADLDLVTYNALLKGSGTGPIVLSANPDESKIWKVLNHAEEPFMPPNRPKLPDQDLAVIKQWILGGLLETAGSKAIAAVKPKVDLALKVDASGKPEGPPPIPKELPLEAVVHTQRGNAITGLAASPWAPVLAVAGQKQVLLYHTDTLERLGILPFTEGEPVDLQFSRSGKLLLAAGGQGATKGRVLIWDVVSGKHLMTLGDDYDTVLAADIRPDQTQVALGGPGRLVKVFSTRSGELQHKIKKHTDWVTALAFSPDNTMLASGDRNGGLSIWDPDSGIALFNLPGHKAAVTALSWRGDSKILASSSEDGTVKWWEMEDGKQAKSWTAHGGGALCVHYAHDGHLVTCGRNKAVTLWKPNGAKVRTFKFFGEMPLRAVFSHDGKRIFATDFAGRVAAWNTADGKQLGELNANPLPLAAQLAAAEKKLEAIQARFNQATARIRTTEAQEKKAQAALAAARQALADAKAAEKARAGELAKLQEIERTESPPSDLDLQRSAAREAREAAKAGAAQADKDIKTRTAQVKAAQAALAKLKKELPQAELATARAAVTRIQSAQARTDVFWMRDRLSAGQREYEALTADLEANRRSLQQAENDLAKARAAIVQAETTIAEAKAKIQDQKPAAEKLAAKIKSETSRLEKRLQDYQRLSARKE